MILTAQQLAKNEALVLQPYAVLSQNTRGRKYLEPEDLQRLPFQKDRDRIIHSRAFRRLKDKTQVFVAHYGDHYRTRLAHSLEVAQVSRDLARMLGLNEDLAEAVALAHDLGHTPFGHAGEHALDECLRPYGLSFEHNEQSRRIVEELEEVYPDWPGLNLSREVIEGLMKHHTSWDNPRGGEAVRPSLEAQIVNFGDEIAYQNHDVDDGLRSGLFSEHDLEEVTLWRQATEAVKGEYGEIADEKIRWARTVSKMIGLMVVDIAKETSKRLDRAGIRTLADVYAYGGSGHAEELGVNKAEKEAAGVKTPDDVYSLDGKLAAFSEEMAKNNAELKDFLMSRLYFHPEVVRHSENGQEIIKTLFGHYMSEGHTEMRAGLGSEMGPCSNVDAAPEKAEEADLLQRAAEVRDFIAGMTDSFAASQVNLVQAEKKRI